MRDTLTPKMIIALAYDGIVAFCAMIAAIGLRYALNGHDMVMGPTLIAASSYSVISVLVFFYLGNYRSLWRFTSIEDLLDLAKAVTIASALVLPVLFILNRLEDFPRASIFIQWPLAFAGLAGSRLLWRMSNEGSILNSLRSDDRSLTPILVAGPSERMVLFLREVQRLGPVGFPYNIVGLLDTDPEQVGHELRGKRILGHVDDLVDVLAALKTQGHKPKTLVVSGGLEGPTVRELFEICQKQGLKLARSPRLTDLQVSDGKAPVVVRPIDLLDLLGRPQIKLDHAAMRGLIGGKRVLVTGAGGTIGSELARQVSALNPSALMVVDASEFNLYQIDLELRETVPEIKRTSVLANVRDQDHINELFASFRPQIVFHAAALKHVPIVETYPCEGVLTNVQGSMNVANACLAHGVEEMVMISTDKAVNPSNVMGASKRIAELYCQALARSQTATRFVTVRFGNVIGSTGSVVPLFQRQIAQGGPVTVTHKDVTRYFMTTQEAVELVLMAAALRGQEADRGRIHVLDMGEPVRIYDLAENMIQMAGLIPNKDIKIDVVGLRPGEKLSESLFHDLERLQPTDFKGILLAASRVTDLDQLQPVLRKLLSAASVRDGTVVMRYMRALVPEYRDDDCDLRNARLDHSLNEEAANDGARPVKATAVEPKAVHDNVRSLHTRP